ncbi:MAG: DUF4345 domain-containing protein [Myxococcota bacterium]|nr:DUF4345 domain-containing protein [Myxococcota bacterium]
MSAGPTPTDEALTPGDESGSEAAEAKALSLPLDDIKASRGAAPVRTGFRLSASALARVLLALVGGVWLWLGAASITQPGEVAAVVDLVLDGPTARFEFRGMYGGLSMAIGLLHIVGLFRRPWLQPTLLVSATLLGGLVTGRITSLVVDEAPATIGFVFLAGEALFALAMLYAAYNLGRASRVAKGES